MLQHNPTPLAEILWVDHCSSATVGSASGVLPTGALYDALIPWLFSIFAPPVLLDERKADVDEEEIDFTALSTEAMHAKIDAAVSKCAKKMGVAIDDLSVNLDIFCSICNELTRR